MACKTQGAEKAVLPAADLAFHEQEYQRLRGQLRAAFEQTQLPEEPPARPLLHEFLQLVRSGSAWRGRAANPQDVSGPTDERCGVCDWPLDRSQFIHAESRCPRCWSCGQAGSTCGLSLPQARNIWQTASRAGSICRINCHVP